MSSAKHGSFKHFQFMDFPFSQSIGFVDAIHFKIRDEGRIQSKSAYVILGTTLDGFKEVLGIWIGKSESSKFWLMFLNELKNRGVKDILIAYTDNLTCFSETIQVTFPQTEEAALEALSEFDGK